ncbi:hypothetical protein S245_039660, partial [Arachis hypogaea]
WSHFEQTVAWLSKTTAIFRQEIDYIKELLEYVEWHPANRVMQQFRYAQPAPE